VEFRDAVRRRRALSEPLAVSWEQVPEAPAALTATGQLQSIVLSWTPPPGASGLGYRIYRREISSAQVERAALAAVAESTYVDSRVEASREYCYLVRAALSAKGVEVEGPPSPEACSRPASDEQPPARPPAGSP
jgi:hypothetical protein